MTCVCKEYVGKIKMVQEWWIQQKSKFLLGYNMGYTKGFASGGMRKFWLVLGTNFPQKLCDLP